MEFENACMPIGGELNVIKVNRAELKEIVKKFKRNVEGANRAGAFRVRDHNYFLRGPKRLIHRENVLFQTRSRMRGFKSWWIETKFDGDMKDAENQETG